MARLGDLHAAQEGAMTNPTTDPVAYTDEELKQALARVIALARSEVLNNAEVEKFWQFYGEILRRRVPSGDADDRQAARAAQAAEMSAFRR